MQNIVADLHLHSTFSDGLNTPEDICQLVVANGLKAFSLTDHDSVGGIARCRNCKKAEFIPGVELTATHEGKEVHILGYYINSEYTELLETLDKIARRRKERLFNIIEKLNSKPDMNINSDEIAEEIGEGSYNRLNLARFMVRKGMVPNMECCFSCYLGDSSESYETVNYFRPAEAIRLIHKSGGIAVLAHPYTTRLGELIPELVEQGLDGIEAYHPSHSRNAVRKCLDWAGRFHMVVSGGSDFHGNDDSPRKILSAGLDGEHLVEFLARNPSRHCVIA